MDIDAYANVHQRSWWELEGLLKKSHLDADEADRAVELYQRVSTHLSQLRSNEPDPTLVASLSMLLAKTRRKMGASRTPSLKLVGHFFTQTLPAALYRLRYWWLSTMAASLVLAVFIGARIVADPKLEAAVGTPEMVKQLVEQDFENYYRTYAASHFSFQVWVNNSWVAALCIAMGVLGAPVLYMLFQNVANVAVSGAIMINHGAGAKFFGLLLPHGTLELTCIFVAGGVGLYLCWSWISPGPRTRSEALAQAGRTVVGIAMGLVVVLSICGALEGFVTPSALPTSVRVGIGIVAEVLFFVYVFGIGRYAYNHGQDGDIARAWQEDREIRVR
ncbi:membrane protein [Winkia neuii]|uniref:stage II sporulation protein M n=1 Tax=Winkia neuii TaxID=33007 RepID=UPI0007643258|nr:stage II sporulation protein M [Winkia neuii]KWZ72965.1 membrane protein [Winkia neuii]